MRHPRALCEGTIKSMIRRIGLTLNNSDEPSTASTSVQRRPPWRAAQLESSHVRGGDGFKPETYTPATHEC